MEEKSKTNKKNNREGERYEGTYRIKKEFYVT